MTGHRLLRRSRQLFDANGNEVLVRMVCTRCLDSKPFSDFGIRKVGGELKSISQCVSCRGKKPGPKLATRGELLNTLRNLYGDLTSTYDDDGAVIASDIRTITVVKTKIDPHILWIRRLMDAEDEAGGPF